MSTMGWSDWTRGVEIEPSIYAADFLRLGEQIGLLVDSGARIFHVDVGDGHFIPPVTIGPIVVRSIAPTLHDRGGRLDCHLMVEAPTSHFPQVKDAGGDSVTFHVEAVDDPGAAVTLAREHDLGVGVACNPDTPLEQVAAASRGADLVVCMTVHPGYSGQAFLPGSLDRIRRLRELVGPDMLIQADGGITAANVRDVVTAGADLIVAGSAVFSSDDIGGAYTGLTDAIA
jgi:ribulose-phosphate 3-epimerase